MTTKRSKYTPGGYALRVRRSGTGKGLFTEEDIPKGACIIEYTGKLVSDETADRDWGKYLFEVDKGKTIDGNIPSNIARYINHSCAPNCEATGPKGKVFIFSLKRIKAGTELFFDYGTEYFDVHIKPVGCRCSKCARATLA
ncbi:MAG: SET domain-containing protein [Patescibacteria group bacterium]